MRPVIEVREGIDAGGWYFVQGGGKSARTLALLAEALGVAASELAFRPRALERKRRSLNINSPERLAARTDFDPHEA